MNYKKSKELTVENGFLNIQNRALNDRVDSAQSELDNALRANAKLQADLAIICLAFKKYVLRTTANAQKTPLSDDEVLAIVNKNIKDVSDELLFEAKKRGDNSNV